LEESHNDVVSDAGPLISLARIGEHGILHRLFGEILIPPAVLDEITRGGLGAAELARVPWLRTVAPENTALVEEIMAPLHRGEAEALVLTEERGALLLLDDRPARRVARERGIQHTGTAAVVVEAGIAGVIATHDVEPMLRRLQADGMRLSENVIQQVLGRLGAAGSQ
jgi:uncharacterized protein